MTSISVVEHKSDVFPSGKYYVGDLCYLLPDEIYDEYVCNFDKEEVVVEIKVDDDEPFLAFYNHTAYGDGCYRDNLRNKYSVDAGLIGIVQLTSKNYLKIAQKINKEKNGKVIEFSEPFEVAASNGFFEFGHIKIETGDK